MREENVIIRPPLGIAPKWYLDERRIDEIWCAIGRYIAANKKIPAEWFTELNSLLKN